MDENCKIDEKSFYANIKQFQDIGMEPEICVCDFCIDPDNCPDKAGKGKQEMSD